MVHGADALLERLGDTDESAFLLRNRIGGAAREGDALVRRLAADHLRELRDDGVTMSYIARMYGVAPERMKTLYDELIPSPPG